MKLWFCLLPRFAFGVCYKHIFLMQSDTVSLSYPSKPFTFIVGDVLFYTFYSNVSFLNFYPYHLLDQSGFFVCLFVFSSPNRIFPL